MKKIMSVGQCNPDHFSIANFINSFLEAEIIRIDSTEEAIERLASEKVDLVLVNRKLDLDYTDGTILIEKMQKDEQFKSIPVMLISNFPEYQEEAKKMGAVQGFGKSDLGKPETIDLIQRTIGVGKNPT
ncbi:MAG: response regulator [Leptospiraceae bacterium]|nr:response regulator [Leptospiraceae bacterium]MCP5512753.1 response regulator [Leptospiraceae bacterium]